MKVKNITERPDGMVEYEIQGVDRRFVYRTDKFKSHDEVKREVQKSIDSSAERVLKKKEKFDKIKTEFDKDANN